MTASSARALLDSPRIARVEPQLLSRVGRVDSSVLLDIFTEDSLFLAWSQAQLTRAAQRGAIILNAVILAEIAPRFSRIETLRSTLPSMGISWRSPLPPRSSPAMPTPSTAAQGERAKRSSPTS